VSKASEWAKVARRRTAATPEKLHIGNLAFVWRRGRGPVLVQRADIMTPHSALRYARWILDTFGEEKT